MAALLSIMCSIVFCCIVSRCAAHVQCGHGVKVGHFRRKTADLATLPRKVSAWVDVSCHCLLFNDTQLALTGEYPSVAMWIVLLLYCCSFKLFPQRKKHDWPSFGQIFNNSWVLTWQPWNIQSVHLHCRHKCMYLIHIWFIQMNIGIHVLFFPAYIFMGHIRSVQHKRKKSELGHLNHRRTIHANAGGLKVENLYTGFL